MRPLSGVSAAGVLCLRALEDGPLAARDVAVIRKLTITSVRHELRRLQAAGLAEVLSARRPAVWAVTQAGRAAAGLVVIEHRPSADPARLAEELAEMRGAFAALARRVARLEAGGES